MILIRNWEIGKLVIWGFFAYLVLLFGVFPVSANNLPDRDQDGVPDADEINIYFTDPDKADTDGDGYNDFVELNFGFSPFAPFLSLSDSDFDQDGLSDRREYDFGTDPTRADTDGDGFTDGEEIKYYYDPKNPEPVRLNKKIEVGLSRQKLYYYLADVRMGEYLVSSGLNNSTPRGQYTITNKAEKAWSPYGLWMPYWMGLDSGRIGLHQLPYWPNGYVEGEDHLGTPASHGCIRLGEKEAVELYGWAEVGTRVFIY